MLFRSSFPRPRQKKGLTIDSSLPAEERIKAMMAGGVSQRESHIIEGSPQIIGDRLAKYLESQKIFRG